jgi:L-asparaginase / beta-aspartyl-peptidase
MSSLIIHGGAGRIEDARHDAYARGLRSALDEGWAVLSGGGTALDAVVRAVASMEADPHAFNAGVGSSLTRDGTVECDACLVDGRDGRSGAVAVVTRARSPIALARLVMERTPHVLIAGAGADALVEAPIDNAELTTAYSLSRLERWRERVGRRAGGGARDRARGREDDDGGASGDDPDEALPQGSATVGAVALDDAGDLAAATSTGGLLGQWPGRIGDAAIPGAGTYADARVAVSTTGKGEAFLRAVTAKALAERLAAGGTLRAALRRALDDVHAMGGSGGLIVALADGRLGWAFDTSHLALAWRRSAPAHTVVGGAASAVDGEASAVDGEAVEVSTSAGIVTVPDEGAR